MGKVHDKSQGKLKKGMRVALITSITPLGMIQPQSKANLKYSIKPTITSNGFLSIVTLQRPFLVRQPGNLTYTTCNRERNTMYRFNFMNDTALFQGRHLN